MYGMELSRLVRQYQNTGLGWLELRQRISLFIYSWGLGKKNLGEDRAADFLLSFLPRMEALVRNYSNYECPFEHYVKVCLEWHMIKFQTDRAKANSKEELYWQTAGKQDLIAAYDPSPVYHSSDSSWKENLPSPMSGERFKRRFLEYLLYHVDNISYRMIDPYADYLGMNREELFCKIKQAEELIASKRDKRESIREKKRTYYIDSKYQEMKLRITEEKKNREEILERMSQLKYKIEKLNDRIARIKMTPTAEQVAELTGSSSSTVGRNIKMVKKLLEEIAEGPL